MIPLRDENPTSHPAIVTLAIFGACVLAYLVWQPTPISSTGDDVDAPHGGYPSEPRVLCE